jgi:hypothetical protein
MKTTLSNFIYWLKNNKIYFILFTLVVGISVLAFDYSERHWPRLQKLILAQIDIKSKSLSPVHVRAKAVSVQFLPPGLTFKNMSLIPNQKLKKNLSETSIEKVTIEVSLWALFKGQLRLSNINVTGVELSYFVEQFETKKHESFDWKVLEQIPIDTVHFRNSILQADIKPLGFLTRIEDFDLRIENKSGALAVELMAPKTKIKKPKTDEVVEFNLGAKIFADAEGLYFEQLKINNDVSQLNFTGSVLGRWLDGKVKNINARIRATLELKSLSDIANILLKNNKAPQMRGLVNLETDIVSDLKDQTKSNFIIRAESLSIDKYHVGHVMLTGKSAGYQLSLKKVTLNAPMGVAQLNGTELNLIAPYNFSTDLEANQLDIHTLLSQVDVKNVPVFSKISAKLPCTGQLDDNFFLDCRGKIDAHEVHVTTDNDKLKTIVLLKNSDVSGVMKMDKTKIVYDAQLRVGDSEGTSKGIIDFKKGFKIDFQSPSFNLKNVDDISGLGLRGKLKISGSTTGTSHTASLKMAIDGNEGEISNFQLGTIKSEVSYQDSLLKFTKLNGQIKQSQYSGNIDINIPKSTINVNAKFPFLRGEDLLYTFHKRVHLPFQITGTGSAQINLWGPLELSQLSYDLQSSLFRGSIYNESFDRLVFNVSSRSGSAEIKQMGVIKAKSRMQMNGTMNPNGEVKLLVTGREFQIEQSENISALKLNMSGVINFDMSLTDHILNPKIKLDGQIISASINDQSAPNSEFDIQIDPIAIAGSVKLFGNVCNSQFYWPWNDGLAQLRLQTEKWNFAQFFAIFSEMSKGGSYFTSVTSDNKFEFQKNDMYALSGYSKIKELILRNGNYEISNPKPMSLILNQGIIETDSFEISSPLDYIRLISKQKISKDFDLLLEGRLHIQLLSLFTPFLDEIRGQSNFSLKLDGPFHNPKFLGSAFIRDGHFKLKSFPHALENVQGDAIFNQKKIVINSVRGRLGGGPFAASGFIELIDLNNVPVEILGQFSDVKLNVPDGFNTRGSGDINIRGKQFPYTLAVNYNIESGQIDRTTVKNISEDRRIVKPSTFLPKFINSQRFTPILLQIQTNIKRFIPVHLNITRIDVKSEISGQMLVEGSPDIPLLTGRINIQRGGKVTFRNNIFEIQSGYVEYKKSNPENPYLNVNAEARVAATLANNEIRDYDIDLNVTGYANDPKITVSSDPPIGEVELISLLTLGFISQSQNELEGTEQTTQGKLANTSYQLGSAFLNEQLGLNKQFESRLGLQFDFSSSYNDTDAAAVHKFTLKKQWTPKFGTSASRSIGKTNTNNVKAEYKINKNVSVIGEWEGRESTGASEDVDKNATPNLFGLDVEFKREFK